MKNFRSNAKKGKSTAPPAPSPVTTRSKHASNVPQSILSQEIRAARFSVDDAAAAADEEAEDDGERSVPWDCCICVRKNWDQVEWVKCVKCLEPEGWAHIICAGFSSRQDAEASSWLCPQCRLTRLSLSSARSKIPVPVQTSAAMTSTDSTSTKKTSAPAAKATMTAAAKSWTATTPSAGPSASASTSGIPRLINVGRTSQPIFRLDSSTLTSLTQGNNSSTSRDALKLSSLTQGNNSSISRRSRPSLVASALSTRGPPPAATPSAPSVDPPLLPEAAADHGYARPAPEDVLLPPVDLPSWSEAHRTHIPTLIHPPAKEDFGRLLTSLIRNVNLHPDDETARLLLYIVARCIVPAQRPESDKNLGEIVKIRIRRWSNGEAGALWREAVVLRDARRGRGGGRRGRRGRRDPEERTQADINADRCNRLIDLGQFSRACKALTSNGIDHNSEAALHAMRQKHPRADPPTLPDGPAPSPTLRFSSEQVAKAIKSFRAGSAPGPSGLRAEHLKAAISSRAPTRAQHAIHAITQHVNDLAAGKLPPSIAIFFCGARLFAANKKDGGHRPVAVGNIFRRLTSKCVAFAVAERAAAFLAPLQLGVGVKGGCEAIVHSIRSIVETDTIPTEEKWLLQVDLDNAFNNVERSVVFEDIRRLLPDIASWVESSYGQQAQLIYGQEVIRSCKGWHQGDPLASLLFAIAAQPIILKIKNEVPSLKANAWFHDDGGIAGNRQGLHQAASIIMTDGPPRGLHLSIRKSMVWCGPGAVIEDPLGLGIPCADPRGVKLLGAPIGDSALCTEVLDARISAMADIVDRLPFLRDPHHEATLLRSCLSIGKIAFAFRTLDPFPHSEALRRFDDIVRSSTNSILGTALSDQQWAQASLPVSMGGLGLRKAELHAPASFVSSVSSLRGLIGRIAAPFVPDIDFSESLGVLNGHVATPFTALELEETPQRVLSHALDLQARKELVDSLTSNREKARLNSLGLLHAGDWLNATPIKQLQLHLKPQEFRVNVLYRLGLPLFDGPGPCIACGRENDILGDHAISCAMSGERIARHNHLRDTIYEMAAATNVAASREIPHLIPGNEARPADVYMRHWTSGKDTAYDVTVTNPLQLAFVDLCANEPGLALDRAKQRKNDQSWAACRDEGIVFSPLPVETFGAWHADAVKELRRIAIAAARTKGKEENQTVRHFFQKLSLTLSRGNAALFLSRMPTREQPEIFGQSQT